MSEDIKKFVNLPIKDKSIVNRLKKYVADQSEKEKNTIYVYNLVEDVLNNFLEKEGY